MRNPMTLGNHKPRIGWRVPRLRRAVSANSILAGRYDPVVRAQDRRGRAPRDRRAGRATRLAGVTHVGQEMPWIVLARYARNRRLGDALQPWAFCRAPRITRSKGVLQTAPRPQHRPPSRALRRLANRLVGILHGCLKAGTTYDEHTAWDHHTKAAA